MPGNYRSGGHGRGGPPKDNAAAQLRDRITDLAPPADLSPAAAVHWRYYAAVLADRDLWTASARDTLRLYCEALALRDRLSAALEAAPSLVVIGADGNGRPHPLISQLRAVRMECRQHASDLCLSPAAALRAPVGNAGAREPTKWERLTARPTTGKRTAAADEKRH